MVHRDMERYGIMDSRDLSRSPLGLVGQQGRHDVIGALGLLRPLLTDEVIRRDGLVHVVHLALALDHLLLEDGLRKGRRNIRPPVSCVCTYVRTCA